MSEANQFRRPSLADNLCSDLEAFFALGNAALGVVSGEVSDLDQLSFDELGVVALEFPNSVFEGFFYGAAGASSLL